MRHVLEDLTTIQSRESLSDREMAERLGVSRPVWSRIRNRRRRLTPNVAMRATGAFPELTRILLDQAADIVRKP